MGGQGGRRDGAALSSASPLPTLELQGVGPVPIETEGWGWGEGGGFPPSPWHRMHQPISSILIQHLLVCSLQEAEALAKKEQQ